MAGARQTGFWPAAHSQARRTRRRVLSWPWHAASNQSKLRCSSFQTQKNATHSRHRTGRAAGREARHTHTHTHTTRRYNPAGVVAWAGEKLAGRARNHGTTKRLGCNVLSGPHKVAAGDFQREPPAQNLTRDLEIAIRSGEHILDSVALRHSKPHTDRIGSDRFGSDRTGPAWPPGEPRNNCLSARAARQRLTTRIHQDKLSRACARRRRRRANAWARVI
jgi:hypothetical protein